MLRQAFDLHRANRLQDAEAGYRAVLERAPDNPDALHLLGLVMRGVGRNEDALQWLQQAVEARPGFAEAHYNLGNTCVALGRIEQGIAAYEQALALQPAYAMAHYNLANAYRSIDSLPRAAEHLHKAVRHDPDFFEAWHNLANILKDMGEPALAVNVYRKVLARKSDLAEAHYNLGLAQLSMGAFEEGFREYEWRWKVASFPSPKRDFVQPLWNGSPFPGKTLLVHAEQGLGDTIQFCRYLRQVAPFGGRIVLECVKSQAGLLGRVFEDITVVPSGEPLPPFDLQIPLLSLPHVFGTTLATVPASCPYLTVDPVRAARWRDRLGDGPEAKVGLVWAGNPRHGNDRNRSMSLRDLLNLPMVPSLRYFSLQRDRAAVELTQLGLTKVVPDLGAEIDDFDDFAAAIAAMDLVISVDTAPAHLAGALAKPIWLLLPFSADWRWQTETQESPWYPTMTLYRQKKAGDWAEVMARVSADLLAAADEWTSDDGVAVGG